MVSTRGARRILSCAAYSWTVHAPRRAYAWHIGISNKYRKHHTTCLVLQFGLIVAVAATALFGLTRTCAAVALVYTGKLTPRRIVDDLLLQRNRRKRTLLGMRCARNVPLLRVNHTHRRTQTSGRIHDAHNQR